MQKPQSWQLPNEFTPYTGICAAASQPAVPSLGRMGMPQSGIILETNKFGSNIHVIIG